MSVRTAVGKALRKVISDLPETSPLVAKGRRLSAQEEGLSSLFAWPVKAIAKKVIGPKKFQAGLYEKYHRPLKNLDERAGKQLSKSFGTRNLFRQVDLLPTGRKIGKNPVLLEHGTYSATAPVGKVTKMTTPVMAGLYAADKLYPIPKEPQVSTRKEHLLKQASDALEQAGQREEAIKVAFEMIERGKIPAFQNFDELNEKVASLLTKDLSVVREALEIDGDMADFGKVAHEHPSSDGMSADEAFVHRIASE